MVAKEGRLFPQDLGKPSWLSEPGERGREGTQGDDRGGKAGPHLQQPLQAATESVQLSAGVCHPMPIPVALEDGRDSSCEEDGGHQTSGSEVSEAPKTPHFSLSSVPENLSPFRSLVTLRAAPSSAMNI